MDAETVGDAFYLSVMIVFAIVVGVAAIVYAFIKKKKNYDSTGIPKRVENPEEHEGSTDKVKSKDEIKARENDVEGSTDKVERRADAE